MKRESELVPVLPDAPEVDALFDQVFGRGWRDDLMLVGVLRSGVLELVARERGACAQAAEAIGRGSAGHETVAMTAEELCGRIWKRLIEDGSGGGYAVTLKYTELLEVIRETMETCAQVADARADAARERHKRLTHPGDVNESECLEATSIAAAIRARAAP